MRVILMKLFCWLCLTIITTTDVTAYQTSNVHSKSAYIDSQWRHKFHTKDSNNGNNNNNNNNNRYALLMMGGTSTTNKPTTWFKYETNNVNNKQHHQQTNYRYSYNFNPGMRIRHSKYPNLDNLLTRLDKLQPSTSTTPAPPSPTTTSPYRYRDVKHSDHGKRLFYNSYDVLDNVDYDDADEDEETSTEKSVEDLEPDYDKWEVDEDNNYLDDEDSLTDDDDDDDDDMDNFQAEEATEKALSITQYKWQHYGTRDRVEESRRNQNYPEHINSFANIRAAIDHALKMDKETKCREPSPRILSVQSIHPDPGKSYLPHCTVLHRCAEDTGCCTNRAMKCGPKHQTLVYLYFYTTTIGKPGSQVEKLPFYNHTECTCMDRDAETTSTSTLELSTSEEKQEVLRQYRSSVSSPATIRRCKCPEEYFHRTIKGSVCTCDCAEGNIDCAQMKTGQEFFSLKDRLCIVKDECGTPACEYGSYLREIGRCPRKQEKFDAFANASTNNH